MESSAGLTIERKAFSASKSVVCDSFHQNIISKHQSSTEKKALKPCASASIITAHEKKSYLQTTEFSNLSTFHDRLKALYIISGVDYEKLFLYASQIVEKLNMVINKLKEKLNNRSINKQSSIFFPSICYHRIKFNLRNLILYHDILKRQLRMRCLLILRDECNFNLKQTTRFLEETKQLFISEKLKIVTMPLQALNRFIGSTDISIYNLELLLSKLQMICGLQMSLNSSFQRIVNVFHFGFNMEIHKFMLSTSKILEQLKFKIFYWVHKNICISIQKLSLVDSNSVSSEFLQKILDIYKRFSLLMSNSRRKHCNKNFKVAYTLFSSYVIKCEMTELPYTFIFQYLSMFESKVAAERIIYLLISECKKQVHQNQKHFFAGLQERQNLENIDTSDYFSVSTSEVGTENHTKMYPNDHIYNNFALVLSSLEQKNQALVLKYVYAFTSLNISQLEQTKVKHSYEDSSKVGKARQTWKVPIHTHHDQCCGYLEKWYWLNFWRKFKLHIFKLLQEIPHHQYGDSSAGTFILWPDMYIHTIVHILKIIIADDDISSDARHIMQKIYAYLYMHLVLVSWDKRLSVALFSSYSNLCPPVPIMLNEVRTNPGNLLCLCLEPLVSVFSNDIPQDTCIKAIQQLQCTMDCFILWSNTKCRAFISSWNISSYLLISFSDCKYACKILENMKALANSCMIHAERSTFCSSLRLILWNGFRKQIANLEGIISETPNLIYQNSYSLMIEYIDKSLKSKLYWTCRKDSSSSTNTGMSFAVEFILNPIAETMNHISDILVIIVASVGAVSEAFLDVLRNRKNSLSAKNIKFLNFEVLKILHWINNLDLSANDKVKIQSIHSLQKLVNLIKLIRSFNLQQKSCFKRNNRIIPITSIDITHTNEGFITAESEVLYSQICSRSKLVWTCCL